MDLFEAITTRRSCRAYLPDPVDRQTVLRIIEAGCWAPSPMNSQPWRFIVVTDPEKKAEIRRAAEACRNWAQETTGWKWLAKYRMDFLTQAPVLLVVVGDPEKSGVDSFQTEGRVAYQHACAAAIQNMLLAAHALGLATLWFTFFDKATMRKVLSIPAEKTPLALICLGKPAADPVQTPRKKAEEKTTFV